MPFAPNPSLTTTTGPAQPWYGRARLGVWIESGRIQRLIIAVIIVNAAVLGVQTSPGLGEATAVWLHRIDQVCLGIFVAELTIKLYAFRLRFFRSGWNVFDFVVVAIALVPGSGFAVLRALRVLRVLRLISVVPALRRVVEALVRAVPGIVSIGALLGLLFYVAAVMATTLFAASFPEYFGTLGASLATLFQTMTMDNWSTISREMAPVYPWVWAFFVPFILLSAFTVLNLFVAVMVDAMKFLATDEPAGTDDGHQADDDAHPGNVPTPDDDAARGAHAASQPATHPGADPAPAGPGSGNGSLNGHRNDFESTADLESRTGDYQDLLTEVRALRTELAESRQS